MVSMRIAFSAAANLGIERFDQTQQARLEHNLIPLDAACSLAFAGVFLV